MPLHATSARQRDAHRDTRTDAGDGARASDEACARTEPSPNGSGLLAQTAERINDTTASGLSTRSSVHGTTSDAMHNGGQAGLTGRNRRICPARLCGTWDQGASAAETIAHNRYPSTNRDDFTGEIACTSAMASFQPRRFGLMPPQTKRAAREGGSLDACWNHRA